jgi:hypothetical protein
VTGTSLYAATEGGVTLRGVALIPKGALSSKRAATVAVIISFVGLLVIPVITLPAMLVAGFGWRSAPRWTRLSLVIAPVIFAVYVLAIKTHAPAAQH